MLAVLGAGTLGSPLAGFAAAQLGALGAFAFCGVGMLLLVALVCLLTDIWGYEGRTEVRLPGSGESRAR
jgi:hypothetical protein